MGVLSNHRRTQAPACQALWKLEATSAAFSVATYAPFGTPVGVSGTDQKWKYAGETLAGVAGPSPGIYYIDARWMDPELGRFLHLDPKHERLRILGIPSKWLYPGSV